MEGTDRSVYEIIQSKIDIILFANAASGSNLAKAYLQMKQDVLSFTINGQNVDVHIFDLQDQNSRISACEAVKVLIEEIQNLRVITAGGDGSLIWVIETFIKQGVNISKILFGILPFGSGNDLSAMLGWERDPPSDLFEGYIAEWLRATPHKFDFWLIRAEVNPGGGFGKVNKTKKSFSKSHIEENGNKKLDFTRLMSNYFSIGLDARIGLGFDKHRTTTKCCNKVMYCWEGFKKMFCCVKTPKIPELISTIKSKDEVIVNNSDEALALDEDTSVLLAMNIRTYAGGDNFVWEKARSANRNAWEKQSPNDKNLEMLTFKGKIGLGLEQIKCTQGQARRLHQGHGPFTINFNETDSKCYMQVDGEYYYLDRPKYISLELWEKTREIKVLFRTV